MMNKLIKIAIVAMSFTIIFATATLAATTGWNYSNGIWHYYKNGDLVTNDWAKSGDYYYYLDEEGNLAVNRLIEDGDSLYYAMADGKMASNTWKYILTENENEPRWYYFQNSAKAVKATSGNSKTITLDGKKYSFDDEGKMLYGFVDDGQMIDDASDILSATYYYGDANDGAMKTGWVEVKDTQDIDGYDDYQSIWLYFGTNGRKVAGTTRTINGSKYGFDLNGVMISGWVVSPASGSSSTKYYSEESKGQLAKNSWIYAIPGKDVDKTDYNDGNYRWFYTNSAGEVYKDVVKKINNKYYAFDSVGRMASGLVDLNQDTTSGAKISTKLNMDRVTRKSIINANYGESLRFFSNDETNDGSMKTGTIKIELADGEYTFGFSSTGVALHGIKNKKLYNSGLLLSADKDEKYEAFENPVDNEYYITNTSGTVLSVGKTAKNADGDYFAVHAVGDTVKITGDEAQRAASNYAKTGSIGTYKAKIIKTY